jgi:adenosine deaminase
MSSSSADAEVASLKEYISVLPKTELHAHLSGSIREETIVELIYKHYPADESEQQIQVCKLKANDPHDKRDLNECFALFKVLHRIVSSREILYRITMEVCLQSFVRSVVTLVFLF